MKKKFNFINWNLLKERKLCWFQSVTSFKTNESLDGSNGFNISKEQRASVKTSETILSTSSSIYDDSKKVWLN